MLQLSGIPVPETMQGVSFVRDEGERGYVYGARDRMDERYDIIQDEFPVDGGFNSRRIDILALDRITGDWLVIELKRAEANIEAVHQVNDYLLALGRLDDFALGKLDGVLIAERIPHAVRKAASDASVTAYEIHWPLKLERV